MAENQEIINATRDFVPRRDIVRVLGVAVGTEIIEIYGGHSANRLSETIAAAHRARKSALEYMNGHAAQMGADAVVGIRFDSIAVAQDYNDCQIIEYTAYGTAVVTVSQY